jgi:ectoine hydroxylase-related dioxygenase (phytanoyl-CoA dioxygenase family)
MTDPIAYKSEELQKQGYCILKKHFAESLVEDCRVAFLPVLNAYLNRNEHLPNRGTNRHFLPMPFEPPCFASEFFFDTEILQILQNVMGENIVADQWGCDVPLFGSDYQIAHVDYQRPLFFEMPGLHLPPYMMVVSFGLTKIALEDGPIELAPGTHTMPRENAFRAVENSKIKLLPVTLDIGDVLIRHPWTIHRGTPNKSDTPRLLVSMRYVRNWYCDSSREVNTIPMAVWNTLSSAQKTMLRFSVSAE